MSFWRKILKLIKKNEDDNAVSAACRRVVRPERIRVTPQLGMHFVGDEPFARQSFELANISTSGMALICKELSTKPLHGMKVFGHLVVGENSYLVKAEIKHIHQNILGCEFVSSKEELKKAISSYLKLEILGAKLRLVSSQFVKKDTRGEVYWYSDGGANELFFVDDGKNLLNFHLSFLGHYLEINDAQQLVYGVVAEDSSNSLQIKPSALVTMTSEVPRGTIEAAETIIEYIEGLSKDHRKKLREFLGLEKVC